MKLEILNIKYKKNCKKIFPNIYDFFRISQFKSDVSNKSIHVDFGIQNLYFLLFSMQKKFLRISSNANKFNALNIVDFLMLHFDIFNS